MHSLKCLRSATLGYKDKALVNSQFDAKLILRSTLQRNLFLCTIILAQNKTILTL